MFSDRLLLAASAVLSRITSPFSFICQLLIQLRSAAFIASTFDYAELCKRNYTGKLVTIWRFGNRARVFKYSKRHSNANKLVTLTGTIRSLLIRSDQPNTDEAWASPVFVVFIVYTSITHEYSLRNSLYSNCSTH